MFFGGTTASGATNELWILSPVFIPDGRQVSSAGVLNAFSYQADAVAPAEIVSIFGSGLGPLTGIAFSFDPATGTLLSRGPVSW